MMTTVLNHHVSVPTSLLFPHVRAFTFLAVAIVHPAREWRLSSENMENDTRRLSHTEQSTRDPAMVVFHKMNVPKVNKWKHFLKVNWGKGEDEGRARGWNKQVQLQEKTRSKKGEKGKKKKK